MFQVVEHHLAQVWLSEVRDGRTPPARFRTLVRRLGALLAMEALRAAPVVRHTVQTPCGVANGAAWQEQVLIVPILRAGLTYAEGVGEVLPEAAFGHIGLYRDEQTHRPVPYFCKLPGWLSAARQPGRLRVYLVDPMLATGHSAVAAVQELLAHGVQEAEISLLTLVAAPEGRDCFVAACPQVSVWTWALDERLNEKAYIVPGLGDAGDRLFGTL